MPLVLVYSRKVIAIKFTAAKLFKNGVVLDQKSKCHKSDTVENFVKMLERVLPKHQTN